MTAERRVRIALAVSLTAVLGILGSATVFAAGAREDARQAPAGDAHVISLQQANVTPVRGPSWLSRLGFTVMATSYGRAGNWALKQGQETEPITEKHKDDSFILTGRDLYRLSCRSCHGADASGVPSEIKSMRGMIRASDSAVGQRKLEMAIGHPGHKLPSADHLNAVEMKALVAYLQEIAGVPGAAKRQVWIEEPAVRVGEHLVKGTCHTCHAAVGPGSGTKPIATPGVPPSLASLLQDRAVGEVIRKAHQGLPTPEEGAQRGTMPILSFVTNDDLVAAYEYLAAFPPKP